MKIGEATSIVDFSARRAQPSRAAEAAVAAPAAEAPRQSRAAPPVEVPKIESVTRQIDSYLRSMNKSLQFRLDESTGQMVVSICDAATGEVIRQVPGEEALHIAQRIEAQLSAILEEKA